MVEAYNFMLTICVVNILLFFKCICPFMLTVSPGHGYSILYVFLLPLLLLCGGTDRLSVNRNLTRRAITY